MGEAQHEREARAEAAHRFRVASCSATPMVNLTRLVPSDLRRMAALLPSARMNSPRRSRSATICFFIDSEMSGHKHTPLTSVGSP